MGQSLHRAVQNASSRPEVRQAVAETYAGLQTEIEARRPLCVASGRCCRFEEFGHRLYVTTMELAKLSWDLGEMEAPSPVADKLQGSKSLPVLDMEAPPTMWDGTGCPFQMGKLCGVHGLRPFGCRVYFCDATSTQWQHDAYERFHGQLRRLHDELEVPYYYVEWRYGLQLLGLAATGSISVVAAHDSF